MGCLVIGTFRDGMFSDGRFSDGMFSDGMFGVGTFCMRTESRNGRCGVVAWWSETLPLDCSS